MPSTGTLGLPKSSGRITTERAFHGSAGLVEITDGLIIAGEWELIDAATATGWAHGSDITKIDGRKIYTDSITADKIKVIDRWMIGGQRGKPDGRRIYKKP